jgi:energy-coupling factor transporter transmembrane protein EcfT
MKISLIVSSIIILLLGLLFTVTLIGAIIGVPLIILGLILLLMGILIPGRLMKGLLKLVLKVAVPLILLVALIYGGLYLTDSLPKNFSITPSEDSIEYSDYDQEMKCILPFLYETKDYEFVIDSEEMYQQLLEYKDVSPECENYTLPDIDFSNQILLAKYAQGTGCSVNFKKDINVIDNQLIYKLIVEEIGLCEMLGMSMNWILIDNYNSDYEVVFSTE